jgi:hypothetical protein
MRLTSPSVPVFVISVVIAVLVAAVRYADVSVPVISGNLFESLAIAYLILLAGNLFRGL